MRLHRFFIEQLIGDRQKMRVVDEKLCHQLKNVFRYSSGDQVVLFDGSGDEFSATISYLQKDRVEFSDVKKNDITIEEEKIQLTLYCSIISSNKFELMVQKCTELGIKRLVPVISERSQTGRVKIERLKKIVTEASEQSGRIKIPVVDEPVPLTEAIKDAFAQNRTSDPIVCSPTSEFDFAHYLQDLVVTYKTSKKDEKHLIYQSIFIGPEGGWSDGELEQFTEWGMKQLSLGKNILRTETAAIISVGCFSLFKDLL